jgi:5'-methylthioadenosine phosphorylase
LQNSKQISINTKYGKPSDKITIGFIKNKRIAFIPRHKTNHSIPPAQVPYLANIEAFDGLNIKRIIATNAVGSLNIKYKPGDFVLFDQFINMTNRKDTFFNASKVVHISSADPYCSELRGIALKIGKKMKLRIHDKANAVIINGPRFSTKAESRFFNMIGGDVINMTQYPENVLAKEKAMCYLGIGIVTDYDAGVFEGTETASLHEVNKKFNENITKLKELLSEIISNTPDRGSCSCKNSLDSAGEDTK